MNKSSISQKIVYFKRIPFMGAAILILLASFITNYFIHIESIIILFLFIFLLIFFIIGIENLFVLLLLSTFIPFEFVFGSVKGWGIADFFIPIFLLLFVGLSVIKKESLNRVPRFSILLLLFLSISLAHVLTLQELPEVIKSFVSFSIPSGMLRIYYDIFICGIAYFLIPFLFREESHIKLFVKFLGAICIFLIILSFIRLWLGIDIIYANEAGRTQIHYVPGGGYIVPRVGIMGVAGYLLFVIGLVFVKGRSNIFFWLITIISIAGIVQSGGRAMFLGLVFAIGLYLFLSEKKYKAAILPVGLLLILFFIGLNPEIARKLPPVFYRHLTIFSTENPSLSNRGDTRMVMYSISWRIISKNPFWGGRSVDEETKYNKRAFFNVIGGEAHNVYLSTAASFGLPAFIIWLIAGVLYLRRIIYLYKKTHPFELLKKFCLLLSILLGVSFLLFFFEGVAGGGLRFYLLLGLIDSAWNMYNKKRMIETNSINRRD